jgi:hypothetical protein
MSPILANSRVTAIIFLTAEFRLDTIVSVVSQSGPATCLGFSLGHKPSLLGLATQPDAVDKKALRRKCHHDDGRWIRRYAESLTGWARGTAVLRV